MVSNEVYTYGFGLEADWAALTRSRPLQNPGKLMHWAVVLQGNEKDELEPFYGLIRNAMTAIGVTHLTPDLIQLNPLQNKSHYAESIPTDRIRFYLCFMNPAEERQYGATKIENDDGREDVPVRKDKTQVHPRPNECRSNRI